jgi:hypothetical protein
MKKENTLHLDAFICFHPLSKNQEQVKYVGIIQSGKGSPGQTSSRLESFKEV